MSTDRLAPSPPAGAPVLPDLDRLVEDLVATWPVLAEAAARDRPLLPPVATLALLGRRLLHRHPADPAAQRLWAHPSRLGAIATEPRLTVLDGSLRLTGALAAFAAQAGLERQAPADGDDMVWEAGLRWLLFDGIARHALWLFLPASFVRDLQRRSLHRAGHRITPLQLLALGALPDLVARLPPPDDPSFDAAFADWQASEAVDRHGWFWACPAAASPAWPGHAPDGPPNPAIIWPPPPAGPAVPTGAARGNHLGPGFPGLRITLDPPPRRAGTASPAGAAPPAGAALDLTDSVTVVPLPAGRLPPAMLLLDIDIAPPLHGLVWLAVLLDGAPVALLPAAACRGGSAVRIRLPNGSDHAAPMLELRFGATPDGFAAVAQAGGCYARLQGLHLWRSQ